MQLSKMPLSESRHEPWETLPGKEDDVKTMKRNMQLFKSEVEKQINNMTARHTEEVRRLCQKIQDQARIIEAYQKKFGRLQSLSPPKKQNMLSKLQLTPSPKKPSHNLQNSQIINTMLQSPTDFKSSLLSSPMKHLSRNSNLEINMALNDQSFDSPPDQLYKSRYEQRSRLKKQAQHEIYAHLKENKQAVENKTQKLLEMVGERKPAPKEEELEQQQEKLDMTFRERRVKDPDEELNTSLSFICESLERSKEKMKKRLSVKPQKKQENPEEEKKKEKKQKLNYILREMRDKIAVKEESPKKEQIKTSKLLTTGHPGTSKVMINPVAVDLARKNQNRADSPIGLMKNVSTSILKNSSEGRFHKTIDGLSAITKVTKQSNPSRVFL